MTTLVVSDQRQLQTVPTSVSVSSSSPEHSSSKQATTRQTQTVASAYMPTAIIPTTPHTPIDSTGLVDSSASSSPTSSSSSSSSSFSSSIGSELPNTVTLSFCSQFFHNQKQSLHKYLLKFYGYLGQYVENNPTVLLVLRYAIASIHAFIVYLLSVILSLAQLIVITATIENLGWIQTYRPFMREWDKYFPGFVFPALDIESESEDDPPEGSVNNPIIHKDARYWASKRKLKECNDHVDNSYHFEESKKRMTIKQSMNSTLRRRPAKFQQGIPSLWTAEEAETSNGIEVESDHTKGQDQSPKSEDTESHLSGISYATTRTSSGHLKPKHVTFNEEVLIFDRKQPNQSFAKAASPMAPVDRHDGSTTHISRTLPATEAHVTRTGLVKDMDPFITSISAKPTPVSLDTMAQDEAEYQRRTASEDTNDSGNTSPTFQPDIEHTSTSLAPSIISPISSDSPYPSYATLASRVVSSATGDITNLRRASSVPLKIGSFFHRHNHQNGSQKNTSRRTATSLESDAMARNSNMPVSQLLQPNNQSNGPDVLSVETAESQREALPPRSRPKRSFSLGLSRHPHLSKQSNTAGMGGSSNDKHNNFMYRIAHPQRYKREMEQHLSQQEKQRLLTLAQLQHREVLEGGNAATSSEAPIGTRTEDAVLCGNVCYYATSAEYVEGIGAPNSVISTSVGIAFPKKLQPKKGRGKTISLRPINVSGRSLATKDARYSYKPLFRPDDTSQSISSLIQPSKEVSTVASTNGTERVDGCAKIPDLSSSSTANTHRPSPLIRTISINSRSYTNFTTFSFPTPPPAQQLAIKTPTSLALCPMITSQGSAIEHTTFAAFGFPSPSPSPINSAPASPRHSISSMPLDISNRIQARSGFYSGDTRQDLNMNDNTLYLHSQDLDQYDGDPIQPQLQEGSQKKYLNDALRDMNFIEESLPQTWVDAGNKYADVTTTDLGSQNMQLSKDHNGNTAEKHHHILSFLQKLSIKKMKKRR
ncbi:hypothetical protein BX616_009946 [Lobosporangium transversale]|nr:hypothetical protein BX616_009946 [Lobosporangium transversale]